MSNEKKYLVESIETNGPISEELSLAATVDKLNIEKSNNRFIFIDGKPVSDDIITEDIILTCKKSINIVNQLIGG